MKIFHDNLPDGKKYTGGRDKESLIDFVEDELDELEESDKADL